MIQRTAFAVAMDETKPILTGELLEIESDRVTLVALDGYRLALCKEPLLQATTPVNFVVPGRSLSEIAKLFEDSDAPASISIGDTQAMVEMGHTKIITRLLEGEYINYRQDTAWRSSNAGAYPGPAVFGICRARFAGGQG